LLLWFTTNTTTQALSWTHVSTTTIWQNHSKVSILNEGIVYSLAMCDVRVCKKKTWKYYIHFAILPLGSTLLYTLPMTNFFLIMFPYNYQ